MPLIILHFFLDLFYDTIILDTCNERKCNNRIDINAIVYSFNGKSIKKLRQEKKNQKHYDTDRLILAHVLIFVEF